MDGDDPGASRGGRWSVSPRTYRRLTLLAALALAVIIVTGALVRLTGSGLGCPDWPECNESRFVDVSSTHGAIEQLNRLFTGLVAVAVVLAVLGSLVRSPRRRDLTWLSLGLVAGVIGRHCARTAGSAATAPAVPYWRGGPSDLAQVQRRIRWPESAAPRTMR